MRSPADKAPGTQLSEARKAALRALAARPRTIAELRNRLNSRFDEAITDAVIDALHGQGLLDDAAYAEAWRSSRERHRPRSASFVKHELLRRGVAPETAVAAVTGMDDHALALQAAESPARRLAHTGQQTFTRRLAAYLGRRGFAPAVIRRTVEHYRAAHGVQAGSAPTGKRPAVIPSGVASASASLISVIPSGVASAPASLISVIPSGVASAPAEGRSRGTSRERIPASRSGDSDRPASLSE